ncbi:hypothetical protein H634G_01724 [Metarhizium anisopliae BRIP 53293]|uniref:Thioesterase domain-containing protein n=1 Tax=Metarhizium anisopliae BRIP 53293 TaxID=1291518 RepID=A0A0D9PFK5_METAN|nr:hypothetical protein H634G_01724 [Metarhizium anisopliae BRIP 53293]KJK89470.1 hypothetical protein H633G_06666 [Metarhizium anisopliae BRIP 53284]
MTESSPSTEYKEFRLHSNKNPDTFARHLVAGSLFGNQKLPIYPRLFMQKTPVPRIIAACYVSDRLCGHPGYVHGGLSFVLFDDIFALCAGMGFESGVAMTANMSINFRKPLLPERLCIIRAEVVRQQGRKAWVEGSVRSLDVFTARDMEKVSVANNSGISAEEANATLVAEATSVFVEPKFAHTTQLHIDPKREKRNKNTHNAYSPPFGSNRNLYPAGGDYRYYVDFWGENDCSRPDARPLGQCPVKLRIDNLRDDKGLVVQDGYLKAAASGDDVFVVTFEDAKCPDE